MKRIISAVTAAVLLLCCLVVPAAAEDYTFKDRDGTEITVPDGAFAAKVVSFTPGDPWTNYEEQQKQSNVLGAPDRTGDESTSKGDLCLGAGGVIVLQFNINIYDGEGLDIYVFEVGAAVEDTKVEVSSDLVTWYDVGVAAGKTAGVDLNGKVPEGSRFRYVRLTDLNSSASGGWPGADIDAVSGLNVKSVTQDWAIPEIDKAEELGLIPDILKNTDLTQNITREEFAAVSVKVYEALSGVKAIPAVNCPFTDTDNVEVMKAYNIGAVNGITVDQSLFAPHDFLNRQQAAAMLTRVFKKVSMVGWTLEDDAKFPLTYTQPAPFADDADISGWARESVYFMAANGIIKGVEDKKTGAFNFKPQNTTTDREATGYANATREQALAIAVRMVENLKQR